MTADADAGRPPYWQDGRGRAAAEEAAGRIGDRLPRTTSRDVRGGRRFRGRGRAWGMDVAADEVAGRKGGRRVSYKSFLSFASAICLINC